MQTEYIVQAIREGGSMYEEDARVFLAEHDAHVRAEVLREAIARLNGVAESASERKQPGLDHAVGVLLDMVTGRDESAGGAS
ncbi:hypothetical protein [Streptomyces sp. NPDC001205]